MKKVFYAMLCLLLTGSLFSQESWTDGPMSHSSIPETKAKSKAKADLNKMVTTGCTDYVFYQDIALNNFTFDGWGISEVPSDLTIGYDDFTFSSTETIKTVIMSVGDFVAGCSSPEFSITFFADNAGAPGAVLASRVVPAEAAIYTKEELVAPWNTPLAVIYNLHIPISPVTLNAGIYWIGIYNPNQASILDGVFWQTVNNGSPGGYVGASAFLINSSLGQTVLNRDFAFAFCSGESTPVSFCDPVPSIEAVCQNITVALQPNGQASITASEVDGGSTGATSSMVSPATFTCANVGANTVTLTVSDDNGNSSTCSATVTVEDNVDPEITLCQGNSIDFNGEEEMLSSTGIDFEAEDACGIATITYASEYISCEQLGETVPVTVTVTDVNGKSSSCVANVLVTGLPCGWMDFGDDGIGCEDSNDASYNGSSETFTLVSEGCYSTNFVADDAAYVKYALCGDGQIIAQVGSISPLGQGWAGISMRESNAPGSKKVALASNLSNFGRREVRTTTNGYSIPQQFFRPGASWLKLVRTGNQFMGYMSSNGINWQMVLGTNVSMNSCIELGLYVTNYNGSSTVTGTFDHVQIIGSGGLGLSTPALSAGTTEALHFDAVDFSIFPNPAKEEIQLDLINYYGQQAKVEILNQLGQPVLQRQLDEVGSSPERFEVTSLSSGTYFIRVSTDEGQKVKRFLIVK